MKNNKQIKQQYVVTYGDGSVLKEKGKVVLITASSADAADKKYLERWSISSNEDWGIRNIEEIIAKCEAFQIPVGELSAEQMEILVRFTKAFDLTATVRALTDGVVVYIHQIGQER